MPSLRSIFLLGLPVLSLALPERQQVEESEFDTSTIAEWEEILKELPGESLKAALEGNMKPKYRDGVFEDGHDAIDAVHNDDPELASKLVEVAKQDAMVKEYLRKRQNSNNSTTSVPETTTVTTTSPVIVTDSTTSAVSFTTETTTSTPDSTTTTPEQTTPTSTEATSIPETTTDDQGRPTTTNVPVESTGEASEPITEPTVSDQTTTRTTQTGVLVPIQVTSTNDDGSTVVQTTNALETGAAPTSVMVDITTTNDQGETITTSSLAPAAIVTGTDDQGNTVTSASPLSNVAVAPGGSVVASSVSMFTTTDSQGDQVVLSSPTPGGVYTVTDARGQLATVTYQPGGAVVSQLRLQTTTLPNGQRSTITSFAEVGGQTAEVTPPPSGTASRSGATPGLQSGAAVLQTCYSAEIALVLGAAIGVAAMLM